MKKIYVFSAFVLLVALALTFVSCGAKEYTSADVAGTYARANEGFDGLDKFTITLNEDGTYQYYETVISSFIGMGNYTVEGDIVTLIAEFSKYDIAKEEFFNSVEHFKFKANGKTLVFIADGSDNFTYVKLTDGAVFDRLKEKD